MANGGPISQIHRQILIDALNKLGDLLGRRNRRLELVCYGGAVCVLFHQSREMTHDVDAIFPSDPVDRGILESLIGEVAQEFNLESRWFNDDVGILAVPTDSRVAVFQHPYLVLNAADWHEMLALKLNALPIGWYTRSSHHFSDAVVFLQHIGQGDREAIFQTVLGLKSFHCHLSIPEFRRRFDLVWDGAFGQP